VADVKVGDELLVDGGMVRFEVIEKIGPDVKCRCTDPGLLLPRANLTFWRNGSLVRERNAMLPTISSKVAYSPFAFCLLHLFIANFVYLHIFKLYFVIYFTFSKQIKLANAVLLL